MATARNHVAITAADTDIALCNAFYAATAGTLVITDRDGTVVTWTVPAGGYALVEGVRVAAASTATGIIGLRF